MMMMMSGYVSGQCIGIVWASTWPQQLCGPQWEGGKGRNTAGGLCHREPAEESSIAAAVTILCLRIPQ